MHTHRKTKQNRKHPPDTHLNIVKSLLDPLSIVCGIGIDRSSNAVSAFTVLTQLIDRRSVRGRKFDTVTRFTSCDFTKRLCGIRATPNTVIDRGYLGTDVLHTPRGRVDADKHADVEIDTEGNHWHDDSLVLGGGGSERVEEDTNSLL